MHLWMKMFTKQHAVLALVKRKKPSNKLALDAERTRVQSCNHESQRSAHELTLKGHLVLGLGEQHSCPWVGEDGERQAEKTSDCLVLLFRHFHPEQNLKLQDFHNTRERDAFNASLGFGRDRVRPVGVSLQDVLRLLLAGTHGTYLACR